MTAEERAEEQRWLVAGASLMRAERAEEQRRLAEAGPSVKVYRDEQAEAHVGDLVRYVDYDYRDRGRFFGQVATVTEVHSTGALGALGLHFPHHKRGTNLSTLAANVRLVSCGH